MPSALSRDAICILEGNSTLQIKGMQGGVCADCSARFANEVNR